MSLLHRISSYPLRGIDQHMGEHLKLVSLAVELLRELTDACHNYNWSLVGAVAERIAGTERKADDVKRNVEVGLYGGRIFVGLKEDFYRLAEAVDQIADKSKEASRALALRVPEKEAVDILFDGQINLRTMVLGLVDIVALLEKSIETMGKDMKAALQMAHDVEKMEEKLDDIKLEILKRLTHNEKRIQALSYLQLRDFILLLDDVADAAEMASDVITEMIVKTGA